MQLNKFINENEYKISKVNRYDGTINIIVTPKKRNCKVCRKVFVTNNTEYLSWKTKDELVEKLMKVIGKPIIKISEMEFVVNEWKDGLYLNCRSTMTDGTKDNWVDVSDLTDFTVCEYNELVDELNRLYPDYPIEHLEGRFV